MNKFEDFENEEFEDEDEEFEADELKAKNTKAKIVIGLCVALMVAYFIVSMGSSIVNKAKNGEIKIDAFDDIKGGISSMKDAINGTKEEIEKNPELLDFGDLPMSEKIEAEVLGVVDETTYVVKVNEIDKIVHLVGITVPSQAELSDFYKDASDVIEVRKIIESKIQVGKTVYLEMDMLEEENGKMLVYLYLEDGTMMQEYLLENGYANVVVEPPNIRHTEKFKSLAQKSKDNQVGLWNGYFN